MNTSTPPEGCATSADTDANADADAPDSVPTAGRDAARQREVQIRTTETASEDSNTSLSSPLQKVEVSTESPREVGRESC